MTDVKSMAIVPMHAFILMWVVGATMVKLAQANSTKRHAYIMMVVRVTIFKLNASGT
jgi:hypothetical protein